MAESASGIMENWEYKISLTGSSTERLPNLPIWGYTEEGKCDFMTAFVVNKEDLHKKMY